MQPPWLPAFRAGIGVFIMLSGVAALVLTWGELTSLVALVWMAFGAFLVWASRFERSGTRLEPDAITVVAGRRPRRLTRQDVLDLRTDTPTGTSGQVEAVLHDGTVVPLLGVPATELERLRRWHAGA